LNKKTSFAIVILLLVSAMCVAGAISFHEADGRDLPGGAVTSSAKIVAGPYVQNMTTDAVTIMWQTDVATTAEVAVSGGGLAEKHTMSKAKRLGEVRVKGLGPDAEYSYTVTLKGSSKPVSGRFRTFPVDKRPVKFIAYGDSRSGVRRHKSVVDAMAKEPDVDFVLHTGDIVNKGRDLASWNEMFFQPAGSMISRVPFFLTLGNHEDNSPYFFQYFSLPGNERFYSFDVGDVHVISLDSCTEFDVGSAQYKWLMNDLEASKSARWKFVMMHHPVYSSGNHAGVGTDGLPKERPTRVGRELMPRLAKQYGITAVFAGHDHAYERSEREGVQYVVTGGGGAPNYGNPNAKHNPYSRKFMSGLHYCVVMVDGDRASMVVKNPGGGVVDKVDLR
jgi:predicted phosphodiesterase